MSICTTSGIEAIAAFKAGMYKCYGVSLDGDMDLSPAPEAWPAVMGPEQAAQYIGLEASSLDGAKDALYRYRTLCLLKGTRVGRGVRYSRSELDAFLDRKTNIGKFNVTKRKRGGRHAN